MPGALAADRAEFLVIGAGALGASAAFHLAAFGRDVVVLDAGPVGSETTSQGAGFLCSMRPTPASTRIVHHSTRFYGRFKEETGYGIDLHRTGGVRVALSKRSLEALDREAEAARRAGVEVCRLGVDDIGRLLPAMNLAGLAGGVLVPDEGYVTATRDVAVGLARAAADLGARIHTYRRVEELRPRPRGMLEVVTSAGNITAEKVVLAANAGMWPLCRQLGDLYPAYPLQHECVVYTLADGLSSGMPTVRIAERDLYLRHEAGGLLVGGVGEDLQGPAPDADDARFVLGQGDVLPSEIGAARRRAAHFFPALDRAFCIRERRGLAMVAPDLEPIAGEWKRNLFVMSADLRGIQSAPALGLMVAQLAAHGESEFDHQPFRPGRFPEAGSGAEVFAAAQEGLRPRRGPA